MPGFAFGYAVANLFLNFEKKIWWRRRELNPRPRNSGWRLLRAQPAV